MSFNESLVSSKSNEWSTPQSLFDQLNDEFNFTLDPCATHGNAKCLKYYTINENGLKQNWSNERVFMNPPYGYETEKWLSKAYEESLNGATVVCLIPARTDTAVWHDIIFKNAKQIRFVRGKIKFGGSKWTAPFSSALVIFSPNDYAEKIIYYSQSINAISNKKKLLV
jgi:site-specific DNA-methyltransferase (adenine-specific)